MLQDGGFMKRRWRWFLGIAFVGTALAVVYVRTHPLVFNESLWGHAHCIKIAGIELANYASTNDGKFPAHPRGYGNALLLLNEDCYFALTGPGYDDKAFHEARASGKDLPEEECGRVYIQGLTTKSPSTAALLFDKLPTPGGDHCHFPWRLWAPLGREVLFLDGCSTFVEERSWPQFAREQVELLVREGLRREEVERLFASKPRQQTP
jgi:hypothetical protein